jgi:hypothetical protein
VNDLATLITAGVGIITPPVTAFLVARHAPLFLQRAVTLLIAAAASAALSVITDPADSPARAGIYALFSWLFAVASQAGLWHPAVTGPDGAIPTRFPRGIGNLRAAGRATRRGAPVDRS